MTMKFLTLEEALQYSKTDLEKIHLAAEANKFLAEQELAEENRQYTHRNNMQEGALAKHARIYNFYAPVKQESVEKCMGELGVWSRRDPGADMKIILNSPGGSVLDGLALFDFIQQLRTLGHHVEVVALGMAASMGGILLQAGNKRTMGRNAWLLIHEVSAGAIGNVSEMEEELETTKRFQDNLAEILAERSNMTTTQIKRRWKKKDWWLSAKEALELGFIDAVEE